MTSEQVKVDRMQLDHIDVEVNPDKQVATITFNYPEKMNRVSMLARSQLRALFEELDRDPTVRTIVLRGAGDKAFSAGGDIAGFLQHTPEELSHLHDNIAAPERCSKPVISAVDGYCFGVALELALAGDFIIATHRSTFALPEVRLGMIPGSGGSQRLLKILGPIRTKWMLMRAAWVPAQQAYEWGFVSRVVENGELDAAVDELIAELHRFSPLTLRVLKRVLNHGWDAPLHAGLSLEGFAYGLLRSTEDFVEGVNAFLQKRQPEFRGR